MFDELLKAYESDDVKLFVELNEKYHLGLESINQIELLENRLIIDLNEYYEDYNAQYMKNYTTSRRIVDMEPLNKHVLKEV